MASQARALPDDLLPLAHRLLHLARTGTIAQVRALLELGAPAWYQDDALGWSALHYAAERRQPELLRILIQAGAVWCAIDKWGRTAGEVCLSLGDREGWDLIKMEGLRTEMLHHMLPGAGSAVTLRAEDKTSSGDNAAFLQSKLTWDIGEDGKERVLDADGNGVMMGWEEPLMREHVQHLVPTARPSSSSQPLSVLNVGYGLGISTSRVSHHVIIEAHPQVLAHMRTKGVYDIPGVTVLEGRWQDWLPARLGDVLQHTRDGAGFDAVFVDTFAEGYEDLKAFFDFVPDILAEGGIFSFWNGLGATNPTIYAVSTLLAEFHMEDVGLSVDWHSVPIAASLREEVWKGVRRRYWELPAYSLPVGRMGL